MKDLTKTKGVVEDLLADVEQYIDEFFHGRLPFGFRGEVCWTPPTDVYETEEEILVTVALPGLRREDISVSFDGGTLAVLGVRREECSGKRRYHKMEIPVGPFARRFRVLRPIQSGKLRVNYEDGLLRIVLPKESLSRVDVPID
jgi:HSP20 family protein